MTKPLSVRLSEDEREALERAARDAGVKPSTYVRRLLGGSLDGPSSERLDDLERRLSRLEQMAGL